VITEFRDDIDIVMGSPGRGLEVRKLSEPLPRPFSRAFPRNK
jgi:hypothetical protein